LSNRLKSKMDGRSNSESDAGTLSPRELDAVSLSTEATESLHLPEKKKLPSLDGQLDVNFIELDHVPDAYQDPVRVHQMLIDERMSANKRQLEFQRLTEELNRLHNQLDDVQTRHDHHQEVTNEISLTQSEKDEITRLNRELSSTKAQLQKVQNEPLHHHHQTVVHHQHGAAPPHPADVELVRAEVIADTRAKFSLEALSQVEAEVDKYRQLYNDARSRLTILTGDFEHAKLEHQDELDHLQYRLKVELGEAQNNAAHFKRQLEEATIYANNELDRLHNELNQGKARIESMQVEHGELAERHQQFVRQVDESREQDQLKLADCTSQLSVERANLERAQTVVELRETEICAVKAEAELTVKELERAKRDIEAIKRNGVEIKTKCENALSMQKSTFERQLNEQLCELNKWQSQFRSVNEELEQEQRNAAKRTELVEEAEKVASEKIAEIKTEQWAVIERLKAEKREVEARFQAETDKRTKAESELALSREQGGAEHNEHQRSRERLEQQLSNIRENKAKLGAELLESQIKNEQIGELKRTIEADQRDKMDFGRQINERDLAIKEQGLIQDSLNKEISTLRNELQRALEEGKRGRDEERINGLEERNRLNQRIDALEGRTQTQRDRIGKHDRDVELIKKKYGSRLKSMGDENMRLKVEKERLNGEMKKLENSTSGVSKHEYQRVKRQTEVLKKRMAAFAMAIKSGQSPYPVLGPSISEMSLSPRKTASDVSLVDLGEINRRLDQIEVDQIKHNKIFKNNQ